MGSGMIFADKVACETRWRKCKRTSPLRQAYLITDGNMGPDHGFGHLV
jgi:hypothetical protein